MQITRTWGTTLPKHLLPGWLAEYIGDGALKSALEKRGHALHPENLRLLPYQPKERVAESLAAAELHLVPPRRGVYGCLVHSKVYGILAVGRPFVAMMEEQAEAAMIAREYSAGYVTPPDDAEALGAVIRRAQQEPAELAAMWQRARWAAESHFDRRTSVRKFAAVLRNLVTEGNAGRLYVTDVESARDNPSGELTGRRQRSC